MPKTRLREDQYTEFKSSFTDAVIESLTAAIELGRFSTPASIKDGLTVRSDLFSEVEEVLGFIRKHINKGYIITGDPQREERL